MIIFHLFLCITESPGDWKSNCVGTVLKTAMRMAKEVMGWIACCQPWVNIKRLIKLD